MYLFSKKSVFILVGLLISQASRTAETDPKEKKVHVFPDKVNVRIEGANFTGPTENNFKGATFSKNYNPGPRSIPEAIKSGALEGIRTSAGLPIVAPGKILGHGIEQYLLKLFGLLDEGDSINRAKIKLELDTQLKKLLKDFLNKVDFLYQDQDEYNQLATRIFSSTFYDQLSLVKSGLFNVDIKCLEESLANIKKLKKIFYDSHKDLAGRFSNKDNNENPDYLLEEMQRNKDFFDKAIKKEEKYIQETFNQIINNKSFSATTTTFYKGFGGGLVLSGSALWLLSKFGLITFNILQPAQAA